jgi:hypothetical protein
MNIYYTAKDIEELSARGVKQLELGPHVIITDFARETAELYGIELVSPGAQQQQSQQSRPAVQSVQNSVSPGKYNKPRGCQHGPSSRPAPLSSPAARPAQSQGAASSSSVNALVDIMGKMLKRGD